MNNCSKFLISLLSCFFLIPTLALEAVSADEDITNNRPNVLLIMVDDLRTSVGAYGNREVKTPNIDALAKEGMTFMRAYSNIPVCGASRASIFTGIRPADNRFISVRSKIDEDTPDAKTLHGQLRDNGYTTISLGKVIHGYNDAKEGWSQPAWHPGRNKLTKSITGNKNYISDENIGRFEAKELMPAWEAADVPDNAYYDGMIADEAIKRLNNESKKDAPFFMAVGFMKPHLPFNAPKKYWELFDASKLSLAKNKSFPEGTPKKAFHPSGEIRKYIDIPKSPNQIPDNVARKLIHGYYASLSYSDAQVGRVLAELDRLDLTDNTIIILMSDHGWSLGEHNLWVKHSNYNNATQAPLIIKVAGGTNGERNWGIAEYVDVYPTIVDMAGLNIPETVQGTSLVSMIADKDARVKKEAFIKWHDGETIVTPRYSYTAWFNKNGEQSAHMLFDRKNDPLENVNLADNPKYKNLMLSLNKRLLKSMAER